MRKIVGVFFTLALLLAGCQAGHPGGEIPSDSAAISTRAGAAYEIYVASFNDSNHDRIGDLNGIKQKLPYLQKLGVEYLWLMPIHPSHSYHKYDVDNYLEIDPSYGTMDDFRALIRAAKDRGIKVIMDMVINHTSSHHPWFTKALAEAKQGKMDGFASYYNFSTKPVRRSTKVADNLYYESAFTENMPDLNLGNPKVKEELTKISKFYLDMGVAGFRLDAALHFFGTNTAENVEFLKWYRTMCRGFNPEVYLVAEVWAGESTVAPYYESGLDSFFNFDLSDSSGQIVKAIRQGKGDGLAQFLNDYEKDIHQINPEALDATYLSNHDQGRSAGFFSDLKQNKLAEAIYLWLPGRPFIYYGEEVGLKGSGRDENKRTFMPWNKDTDVRNPPNTDYDPEKQVTQTVQEAMEDRDSLYNYIAQLLAVRNSYPFLEHATFVTWKTDPRLLAFKATARKSPGSGSKSLPDQSGVKKNAPAASNAPAADTALVAHNLSEQAVEVELPAGFELVKAMNPADFVKERTLHLEPYSSAFTIRKTQS